MRPGNVRLTRWRRRAAAVPVVLALAAAGCAAPDGTEPAVVRLALFNVRELSAAKIADVDGEGVGRDPQLRAAATIVQRLRPDVLVIQEIDGPVAGEEGAADPVRHARRFADVYLATGEAPIDYPHAYAAPVNTGVLSGFDLNGDGLTATREQLGLREYGDDCWGWGTYPGQYGMAVLSRHPLLADEARTFRTLRWRDLPGHHLPPGLYPREAVEEMPLSSKSHWDLPVQVGPGGARLHLWVSHPTPPVFDGPEDRNGMRNHDELKFWMHYIAEPGASWIVDDAGDVGGLADGAAFVVAGDLNADPADGDAHPGAIAQLLDHPRIDSSCVPTSTGGAEATADQKGINLEHRGDPAADTSDFSDEVVGNYRLDYVLPSRNLGVDCGVFWPGSGAPLHETASFSDHRLVWIDVGL